MYNFSTFPIFFGQIIGAYEGIGTVKWLKFPSKDNIFVFSQTVSHVLQQTNQETYFLSNVFLKMDKTRKHCFQDMFSKVGQTRKHFSWNHTLETKDL